ncbi:MAG: hypothetical protein D6801_09885, partial [Alphaproteobacteria bacterium]
TPLRQAPGLPFREMLVAPAYLGASAVLVLSVVLLRQSGRAVEGLALLALVPGFFYVQYQNWGNDPQWLVLLGVFLLALRPAPGRVGLFGWDLRSATGAAAVATLAFAAPSAINLAWSPLRHLNARAAEFVPVVPGSGRHEDILDEAGRALYAPMNLPLDGPGGLAPGATAGSRAAEARVWHGDPWPHCQVTLGYSGWLGAMAGALRESGKVAGKTIFVADVLQALWLFGAGEPLRGAAPWYYGGLAGWEGADLLLVPTCAERPEARALMLEAITATGERLTEIDRGPLYVLYAKEPAGSGAAESLDQQVEDQ